MEILYMDKRILVCVKPYGVLSTDEEGGVPQLLRQQLGESVPCLRTVHRLDRVVGGVMVLARSREAARRLSESIRTHAFQKTYLAVVQGTPEEDVRWEDLLQRDPLRKKTFVTQTDGKDVRRAVLRAQTIESRNGVSLLRIDLETGRTHQIRAQCSAHGFPIAGDEKYGSAIPGAMGRIALWCHSLSFPHPQSGERVTFCAPPLWHSLDDIVHPDAFFHKDRPDDALNPIRHLYKGENPDHI